MGIQTFGQRSNLPELSERDIDNPDEIAHTDAASVISDYILVSKIAASEQNLYPLELYLHSHGLLHDDSEKDADQDVHVTITEKILNTANGDVETITEVDEVQNVMTHQPTNPLSSFDRFARFLPDSITSEFESDEIFTTAQDQIEDAISRGKSPTLLRITQVIDMALSVFRSQVSKFTKSKRWSIWK